MSSTLVIQSHRSPLPYPWIEICMETVRNWCKLNAYAYRFIGDTLFDCIPDTLLLKSQYQRVIRSDLARLLVLRDALKKYQRVVWLDADFLIFDTSNFVLPESSYAVGREVWLQHNNQGKLKAYKKVHNAMLMFRSGNAFLDFYIDTAQRLLVSNSGSMSPQFIGPKLLTALHNIAMLPVMETAGMLSPPVIRDMLAGEGPALTLFRTQSPAAIAGANLCISSCDNNALDATEMEQVIDVLLRAPVSNPCP
ncbi:MAG: hypothetical protein WBN96_12280 [Gammaproteobacteria bacterium]